MSESTPTVQQAPDALLRRLEWTVMRRLDGVLHGDYRTLFRGHGLDLADLREYVYHDDVRHIDWNVTARLQTPYVREYNEEREVAAWFLLDLSPSVDFGSQSVRKQAVSAESVTVLSRENVRPQRATNLTAFLRDATQAIKRRSMVFVVSDFISSPGWCESLALLAQRHEVIAVRLYDPLEMELPDMGMLVIQDAETGEQLFVDTHDRKFRKRFSEIAKRREAELRSAFAQGGVDALELSTGDDIVDAILRFADLRKRRRQLAGGGSLPKHLVA